MNEKNVCLVFALSRELADEKRRTKKLIGHLRKLHAINADLRTQIRKLWQITEALGDVNRLYAAKSVDRPVTESEALKHYLNNGGPDDYARRHNFKKCFRRHLKKIQSDRAASKRQLVA